MTQKTPMQDLLWTFTLVSAATVGGPTCAQTSFAFSNSLMTTQAAPDFSRQLEEPVEGALFEVPMTGATLVLPKHFDYIERIEVSSSLVVHRFRLPRKEADTEFVLYESHDPKALDRVVDRLESRFFKDPWLKDDSHHFARDETGKNRMHTRKNISNVGFIAFATSKELRDIVEWRRIVSTIAPAD